MVYVIVGVGDNLILGSGTTSSLIDLIHSNAVRFLIIELQLTAPLHFFRSQYSKWIHNGDLSVRVVLSRSIVPLERMRVIRTTTYIACQK